ncbi:MAG: hypothetical protein JST11_09810 [Acidobacteria bacterium]|nr:hypothetical protein [Acidobacteriota bacterium]
MRALLSALLLVASSYAAPPTDVLLPPNATVVFGLRAANIIKLIASQGATQLAQFQAGAMLGAMPVKGFDPFHDIDEVVLATSGKGNNPPFLAVITGHFDAAKLAQGKGRPYGNAVFIDDKNPRQTSAILGDSTLLAGDRALVRAAIDRASGNTAAGPLAARIESMRAHYDLWAFADHFDPTALPGGAAGANGAADPLRSLDRFWVGMAFNTDLTLDAELHLSSDADAAKLSGLLSIWKVQALSQVPNAPAMKFDLGVKDNTIKLAVSIPEAELKKAMQQHSSSGVTTSAATTPMGLRITGGDPAPKEQDQKVTTDPQGNTVTLSLPYRRK